MDVNQSGALNLLLVWSSALDRIEGELAYQESKFDSSYNKFISLRQQIESLHGDMWGLTAPEIVLPLNNAIIALPLRFPLPINPGECALQWQVNEKIVKLVRERGYLVSKIFSLGSDIPEFNRLIPNHEGKTTAQTLEGF